MFYSGKRKFCQYCIYFHFIWPRYLWKRNAFCSYSQYCLVGGAVCFLVTWHPPPLFCHWLVVNLKTKELFLTLAVCCCSYGLGNGSKDQLDEIFLVQRMIATWKSGEGQTATSQEKHISYFNLHRLGNFCSATYFF